VSPSPDGGGTTSALEGCAAGEPLRGASYDITKSRFAFGSVPVREEEASLTRWVGEHGVVAIWANGAQGASMNAGAPESALPDWSADGDALLAHAHDYFVAMGVAPCQATVMHIRAGSSATIAGLVRTVDGIPVGQSNAWARFVVTDQTTAEGFYWPSIPADVVTAARDFRDRLASPVGLAAFKAALPPEARDEGRVVINHTDGSSTAPFAAVAVYEVLVSRTMRSYDQSGADVTSSAP
jgi:hypothetical protein